MPAPFTAKRRRIIQSIDSSRINTIAQRKTEVVKRGRIAHRSEGEFDACLFSNFIDSLLHAVHVLFSSLQVILDTFTNYSENKDPVVTERGGEDVLIQETVCHHGGRMGVELTAQRALDDAVIIHHNIRVKLNVHHDSHEHLVGWREIVSS